MSAKPGRAARRGPRRPPLIITEDQIDEMFRRFGQALDDTAAVVKSKGLAAA
ncbi:MAG TPA: hypothetical protein VGB82_15735 [Alphaproteobacteria bacterium]